MAAPLLTPAAKGDWTQLLDRIEASIARALVETAAQEQTLETKTAPSVPGDAGVVGDRLCGLRVQLSAAGRLAEAVEALLAADEEEVRAWTGLAGRVAARLESLPGARV